MGHTLHSTGRAIIRISGRAVIRIEGRAITRISGCAFIRISGRAVIVFGCAIMAYVFRVVQSYAIVRRN